MFATNSADYAAARRAEARAIVADARLCAERPHLRRFAWDVLRETAPPGAATLNLTRAMRAPDAGPETAA